MGDEMDAMIPEREMKVRDLPPFLSPALPGSPTKWRRADACCPASRLLLEHLAAFTVLDPARPGALCRAAHVIAPPTAVSPSRVCEHHLSYSSYFHVVVEVTVVTGLLSVYCVPGTVVII